MSQSLVKFVKKEAGKSLRAVVKYEQASIDVQYHRDDLSVTTVERRVHTIFDQITTVSGTQDDELTAELGRKRATLQVREEVVVIHLLENPFEGHIISLEPDAARDLTTFLAECLNHVE